MVYAFKRYNINFYRVANLIVVPVSFILILGRLANFVNQELVGKVTNVSWCFNFANYVGCRHPYQLYSAIKRFTFVGILIYLQKNYNFKEGFIFWLAILLMGLGRFSIDFFRDEMVYLSLTMGQWLSLVMVVVSAIIILKYYSKNILLERNL